MMRKKYMQLVGGWLGLLLVAGSCHSTGDLPEEMAEETWAVPVSFVVQSSGLQPGRPVASTKGSGENPTIDNMRELYANKVQVNFYRRPDGNTYADNEEKFVLEQTVELDCQPKTAEDGNNRRYARGTVYLQKGFEYRATAIAYADREGVVNEKDYFRFPESVSSPFKDARISLTDESQYKTPELFFGTLRYGGSLEDKTAGEVLFAFSRNDGKQLAGWLYRCVAGVQLSLENVPSEVKEIALLSNTMSSESKATCYDDFLEPDVQKQVEAGTQDKYEIMKWTRSEGEGNTDVLLMGGNLLPVTTLLSVRITKENDEVIVMPLRLHKNTTEETKPVYPDEGCGTGILPAEDGNTDENLAQGKVRFLRNYYYYIVGDYEKLVTQNMTLVVTINPYWDGDADLSLGGK